MKTLTARLRKLQQHLGVRQELVGAIVLTLLAVAAVSFTLTTRVGTPAGEALAYMAAVDRADTDYVWSHSIIDSISISPATVMLLSRSALAAQLKASAHTRWAFAIQSVGFVSSGTKVTLTYETSAGPSSVALVMRGGGPHSWPVLLEPAGLVINLPTGAGAVAIDGQMINSSTGGDMKVAVLTGHHILSIGASRLTEAYSGDVDAESKLPTLAQVDLSSVKVTDETVSDARQATSGAIAKCVAATVLQPQGCPQALTTDYASGGATWSVLGDPLAGSSANLGQKSDFQVTGHYLMRLTYKSTSLNRTRALAVGGSYAADLKWDGQTMSVTAFAATPPASSVPRPAATDPQVLAVLKTQFDSCLALQAGSSPGCPQQVAAIDASKFLWHANSDPLQGATIAWDSKQGFYKVSGSFDFSVDYDSTPPYGATRHYQDHSTGQYIADLYWDGSKVIFVGFE